MKEMVIISGKGGTGKTCLTASFGFLSTNKVMADCDVDAADLHIILQPQILEKEEAPDAKCVAAWKLGEIKDNSSIPALIKAVKDENNNKDILALSIWALGEVSRKNTNNKSIISALYRASRSKNPEIKRHAYIALRKARDYVN